MVKKIHIPSLTFKFHQWYATRIYIIFIFIHVLLLFHFENPDEHRVYPLPRLFLWNTIEDLKCFVQPGNIKLTFDALGAHNIVIDYSAMTLL